MKAITTAVFGALVLSACATTEAVETAATDASTVETGLTDEQAADLRRSHSYKMVVPSIDGGEVICKTTVATGSRLRKNRICGTAAEWKILEEANDQYVKEWTVDRGSGHGSSY